MHQRDSKADLSEQAEERISKLEDRTVESLSLRNKGKRLKKSEAVGTIKGTNIRTVRHGSPRRKRQRKQWKNNIKNSPNLMKGMNLNIQKTQ